MIPGSSTDHVEVVLERIGANTEATTQNGTHRRLIEACDALGYEHRPIWRNATLDDDPGQLRLLPCGLPAGLQAVGHEDLAPGLLGRRRPRCGRRAR